MSEPTTDDVPGVTTDEMLAWLDGIMEVGASLEWSQIDSYDAAIARAIAARLRQASGKAEPLAGRPRSAPTQHWSVTVRRNGEEVVTIESNCLSGRELNAEDEDAIRTAGTHLLAFVGEPALTPSTGKAEPAPTYDAQPPGLTVLAPKRPVE